MNIYVFNIQTYQQVDQKSKSVETILSLVSQLLCWTFQIEPESRASEAGLKLGDKVCEVNCI